MVSPSISGSFPEAGNFGVPAVRQLNSQSSHLSLVVAFCSALRERDVKNPGSTLHVPVT